MDTFGEVWAEFRHLMPIKYQVVRNHSGGRAWHVKLLAPYPGCQAGTTLCYQIKPPAMHNLRNSSNQNPPSCQYCVAEVMTILRQLHISVPEVAHPAIPNRKGQKQESASPEAKKPRAAEEPQEAEIVQPAQLRTNQKCAQPSIVADLIAQLPNTEPLERVVFDSQYTHKALLLIRYEAKCVYCKRGQTEWTIDHVIPEHNDGQTIQQNLVLACVDCNRAKGCQDIDVFAPETYHEIIATLSSEVINRAIRVYNELCGVLLKLLHNENAVNHAAQEFFAHVLTGNTFSKYYNKLAAIR